MQSFRCPVISSHLPHLVNTSPQHHKCTWCFREPCWPECIISTHYAAEIRQWKAFQEKLDKEFVNMLALKKKKKKISWRKVFKAVKDVQWSEKVLCLCQETWERNLFKSGLDQYFVWRPKKCTTTLHRTEYLQPLSLFSCLESDQCYFQWSWLK